MQRNHAISPIFVCRRQPEPFTFGLRQRAGAMVLPPLICFGVDVTAWMVSLCSILLKRDGQRVRPKFSPFSKYHLAVSSNMSLIVRWFKLFSTERLILDFCYLPNSL